MRKTKILTMVVISAVSVFGGSALMKARAETLFGGNHNIHSWSGRVLKGQSSLVDGHTGHVGWVVNVPYRFSGSDNRWVGYAVAVQNTGQSTQVIGKAWCVKDKNTITGHEYVADSNSWNSRQCSRANDSSCVNQLWWALVCPNNEPYALYTYGRVADPASGL